MKVPRWRTLAGVTLVTLCAVTATAQAEMVQELRIGLTPSKAGKVKKPKAASIRVTISSPTPEPSTTEGVTLFFSKGIQFNNRAFPTCTQAAIQRAKGIAACPKGSIVGKGSARAVGFLGGARVPEDLTVTAVNGPRDTLLLYVKGTNPLPISDAIVGKLAKANGQFGSQLKVTIQKTLREIIPGTYAPLVYFDVTVKGTATVKRGKGKRAKKTKVNYVETTACPKSRQWPFRGDFTFDQQAPFVNGPLQVQATQKCR